MVRFLVHLGASPPRVGSVGIALVFSALAAACDRTPGDGPCGTDDVPCPGDAPAAPDFLFDETTSGKYYDYEALGDFTGDGVPEVLLAETARDKNAVSFIADGAALAQGRYDVAASLDPGPRYEFLHAVAGLGGAMPDTVLIGAAGPSDQGRTRIATCVAGSAWDGLDDCPSVGFVRSDGYVEGAADADDQDGDGVREGMVYVDDWTAGEEVWIFPLTGGEWTDLGDTAVRLSGGEPEGLVDAGDVDGDGFADVLLPAETGSVLFLGPVREDRTLSDADVSLDPIRDADLSSDLDGDGRGDLLWYAYQGARKTSAVSLAGGTAVTFAELQDVVEAHSGGDLDGDGRADVLANADEKCFWSGPLAGSLERADATRCFGAYTDDHVVVHDVHGDGYDDVVGTVFLGSVDTDTGAGYDAYDVGFWSGGP